MATPAGAQQVPGGGGWAPATATGAAGDNTYQGFVDQPSNGASVPLGSAFHVSGWFVDSTAEGWVGADDVQVLNGGTVLAHGSVADSRPDVAAATGNPFWAASGFDVLVPGGGLAAGPVNLTVAEHTPGKRHVGEAAERDDRGRWRGPDECGQRWIGAHDPGTRPRRERGLQQ
ncbi:MAG: hypothetical protein LC797_20715 [Chloroflexi bacterium]|nr:hypothetical protein [Chloroflexota bacterium]